VLAVADLVTARQNPQASDLAGPRAWTAPPPPDIAPAEGGLDVSKQADVGQVMRSIHLAVDGVHGVIVATRDGLPVATTAAEGRAEKVAAMAASVLALSQQAVADPETDDAGQTVIRGSEGCLVVQGAGPNAVLAVHTGAKPNMGLVQVEVPRAAADLALILG
jgi:predicted regulator of Ras-like GTPase activity (Roadblock/LC7/MglB family)